MFYAGFNLIVCHFALGDLEKLKKSYLQFLAIPQYNDSVEEEDALSKSHDGTTGLADEEEDDLKREYNDRLKYNYVKIQSMFFSWHEKMNSIKLRVICYIIFHSN